MANRVILKKSSVTGKIPQTTDLEYGELALNYADGKLYYKSGPSTINAFSQNNEVTIPDFTLDDITSNGASTSNFLTIGGLTVGELVYPSTDGGAGQVLATDGNGNLTFIDQSTGGQVGESVTFNVVSRSGNVAAKLTGLLQQYMNFDNLTYRHPTGVVETRLQTVTVLG